MGADNPQYSLGLGRSSWEQIFESLRERSLGKMTPERDQAYFEQHGTYYSDGNFWAAIQSLQAQFEEFEKRKD